MPGFGRRRLLLTGLILTALRAHSWAAADPAILSPVQALIAALLTTMKQGRAEPFATRMRTLAPAIDNAFDLDTILRESTGAAWAGIPPAQQDALRGVFREYTIASYVHSFDAFTGQRFDVQPDTRAVGNGAQIVQTRVIATNEESHELDYVMRAASGGAWRITDVLADGSVSRVAVQRSDFRRLLTQGGATALIDSLRAKVAELAEP